MDILTNMNRQGQSVVMVINAACRADRLINKLIGFIVIFVGVVMMLVALYTIGFTISDAILTNY